VSWIGGAAPPLSGGANVTFFNVPAATNVAPTASVSAGAPGADSVGPLVITLSPSVVYQLTAQAIIAGGGAPGSHSADADWAFTLTAIPEAGSLALLSPVVLGVALGAWWSRRRCQQ
jgi:hypothetical protein